MTRFLFLVFFLTCISVRVVGQSDEVGPGHALTFDGINDYIDLGNIYDNLQLPVTISAWVQLDAGVFNWAPVFVSQDNAPVYNGFWFIVQPTTMAIGYGDGLGENDPAFRRGKTATFPSLAGRWAHITGIIRGATDMDLYVNGVNVGGSYSGYSTKPMSATTTDIAKIGYWYSNSQVTRFKGRLDEVRIWNRSLSQAEVRSFMCKKIVGNESGIIGAWSFNELTGNNAVDNSVNHFNGTLKNAPSRVFSGAALGDKSTFQYLSNWINITIPMIESLDNVIAKNIRGNPEGVQIYEIGNSPSQANGLETITPKSPYFGVFIASLDNNNLLDLDYNYNGTPACDIRARKDNSVSLWSSAGSPVHNVLQQSEFVKSIGNKVELNLGPDQSTCNQNSLTISSDTTNAAFSYVWNTGAITSGITVSTPGKYWLKILGGCNISVDTVNIKMSVTPVSFSLGSNVLTCPFVPTRLQPYSTSTNLKDWEFTWQDGSRNSYFDAKQYGEYWVGVKNSCGEFRDTISFQMSGKEINLNLGPDISTCNSSTVALITNVEDKDYTYLWSIGATSPGIVVSIAGKYWLKISDGCRVKQDTVTVKISSPPAPVYLGENENRCPMVLRRLQLDPGKDDLVFTWQDGSTQSYFDVKEYGQYWVVAKNSCGEVRDSISFTKPELAIDKLPNIITPNGDEYNQYFSFDSEKYGKISLLVFNRWGKRVYHSDDYKNNWDGGDLVTGVYFYTVKGECLNEIKGSISIIR